MLKLHCCQQAAQHRAHPYRGRKPPASITRRTSHARHITAQEQAHTQQQAPPQQQHVHRDALSYAWPLHLHRHLLTAATHPRTVHLQPERAVQTLTPTPAGPCLSCLWKLRLCSQRGAVSVQDLVLPGPCWTKLPFDCCRDSNMCAGNGVLWMAPAAGTAAPAAAPAAGSLHPDQHQHPQQTPGRSDPPPLHHPQAG